jgi:hypothetical protein
MTTTSTKTIQNALDNAEPGELESALQKIALGSMLTPIEETITLVAVATHVDLLTDSSAGKAAQQVIYCRVTSVVGGTGAAGCRQVFDASATPRAPAGGGQPGVATISADGNTITFEGTVKAVLIKWLPVPTVATSTTFTD